MVAGPSKGPDCHRPKGTPHPTSSLGHPLPSEREKSSRAPSPAGAGRGPHVLLVVGVRGLLPGRRAITPEDVKPWPSPRQSRGISLRISLSLEAPIFCLLLSACPFLLAVFADHAETIVCILEFRGNA